tara:strand:+ start:2144 stop:2992 length:849 start_codon:yes stop_codon:yes gene_type:complete
MSEIPQIGVRDASIPQIGIRQINVSVSQIRDINIDGPRIWLTNPPQAISPVVPVTSVLGKPIVDMPGCVEAHSEDEGKAGSLVDNDPKGVRTYCDAGTPSFSPMDYEPEQLTITTEAPVPKVPNQEVPPAPEVEAPSIPKTDTKEDPPCPPPNAPRIGDVAQSGNEAVSGYELQVDPNNPTEKICVTLYEELTVVEKYLPSANVVTTTAGIAVAATTSALLAKPLADLLLKVVKPVVKKVITKVQTILGKTPPKPSRSEVLADQYRLKKGLPPLKLTRKKKK